MGVRGGPGIRFVEMLCPEGRAKDVARFYQQVLQAQTRVFGPRDSDSRGGGDADVAVVTAGPGIHLVFRGTGMLHSIMLCHITLCYIAVVTTGPGIHLVVRGAGTLCYVAFRYVMLCYVMLFCGGVWHSPCVSDAGTQYNIMQRKVTRQMKHNMT
jgi:hypothetical protein